MISVIIINYNTFTLTKKCIESVYQFTKNIEFEIILVDNASVECDAQIFKSLFPDIRLIKNDNNVGFAKGNNIGIEQASGEFILLLNSDIELTENSIQISVDFLKRHKDAGVVSPMLTYPDGTIQSVGQRFPSVKYQLFELFRLQKLVSKEKAGRLLLGSFFNYNTNTEVDWVWGAFFLFKKEILLKLPGQKLDDSYFMYYEDMQWCLDIKKLGYKILYLADTKAIHHMGGSSGKKTEMMRKNGELFLERNFSPLKIKCIKLLQNLLKTR